MMRAQTNIQSAMFSSLRGRLGLLILGTEPSRSALRGRYGQRYTAATRYNRHTLPLPIDARSALRIFAAGFAVSRPLRRHGG
jgi:hypothetical protein